MSKYQNELDQIKPSDTLLAKTLQKVHEENHRFREETEQKHAAFRPSLHSFNWRMPAAIAACLCLLAAGIWLFRASSVSVTKLDAAVKPFSVSVAYRGRQDVTESEYTAEDFSVRSRINFASIFPDLSLTGTNIRVFTDTQGTVIGDYGELEYTNGDRKIMLYISTTDPVAPGALLEGTSRQLNETQVWFGKSDDGQTLYAAWVQNGTALCAQGTGMHFSAFERCIKSALES